MTLKPELLSEFDALLVELNRASAQAILPLFRAEHGLEDKGPAGAFDPVTQADKGAEAVIRKLVGQRYPDHGVIGEEYGEDRPDAEFVWVIDPIDGTRAFISGLPVWTTLIGLRCQGEPVLGSIGQPYVGELFIGSQAQSSRLMSRGSSRPLKVRPCERLTQALIATTDPAGCFDGAEAGAWAQVRQTARLARTGCDAYAYAMVAAGPFDDRHGSLDVPALQPRFHDQVHLAGGIVTDWRGERVGRNGGQLAIAGDRRCLDEALVALRRAAK